MKIRAPRPLAARFAGLTEFSFFPVAGARAGRRWSAQVLILLFAWLAGASQARALTATPSTTEGPYYTMSSANTVTTPGNSYYDAHFFASGGADNDLTHLYSASSQSTSTLFLLSGALVTTAGTPIPGATIELWEADNGGIYWYNSSGSNTNNYANRDKAYQGYGRCVTDSSGGWSFRTVKPGLYTGRIRHFHFKININGVSVLTTQFMFSEDSASFSSDNVAAPLVQAGTMSLVTLTPTTGTDSSGNTALIASNNFVVSYSGVITGAPTVTSHPVSVTPATGSSATFTVAATGTGTLSYQWYKGTSLSNGTAISGATSATYTIASVTTSSVGGYYCIVKNTVGTTVAAVESNPAALTIGTTTGSAPSVTSQPTSQTVAVGGSATFSVVASSGTLSYQWYKGTVSSGTAISGANASSYTISNATTASAGTYYAVISNSYGTTTTSGATLTVSSISAPSITTSPSSVSVLAGNSASFSVTASGSGTLSYQWYKGTAGSGVAISGATASTYTISSTTTASAGTYYAVVTNTGGNTTSSAATVTVTEPYANFLTTYGLTSTTGAANADPDSDGIPNALEYLLGGDPTVADDSVLPKSTYQLVNGSTALVMTFNLAVPVGSTTWSVEYSTDMTTWTTAVAGTGGVTVTMGSTGTAGTAGRTLYPVTVVIPTTATQIYARVRVVPAQ